MINVFDELATAIHESAHNAKGGLERLAKQMNINAQSLRNKVNPTNEMAKLSVAEWQSMLLITNDLNAFYELATILGLQVSKQETKQSSILKALLDSSKQQGDVANEIQLALEDGIISSKELKRINKEINEQQQAIDILKQSIASE